MADQGKQQMSRAGAGHGRMRPQRMMTPLDELERMFGELIPGRMLSPGRAGLAAELADMEGRIPRVDVVENDNEIVVRAEVPGVKKDDLDISVDDNTVTIRGTSAHEERTEEGDYFRCEISRGSFARTVALPGAVDSEKVKAKLTEGVLELTMPKLEGAKRRKIKVQ